MSKRNFAGFSPAPFCGAMIWLMALVACAPGAPTRIEKSTSDGGQTVTQDGTKGDDRLSGRAKYNDLSGNGGADVFWSGGVSAVLNGGSGNDRYLFNDRSAEYTIYDEGGANVLEIEGRYSKADIKVSSAPDPFIEVKLRNGSAARRPSVFIQRGPDGSPTVQRLRVGGVDYDMNALLAEGDSQAGG